MNKFYLLILLLCASIMPSQAGIMAASTRVIYEAGMREKSLMLANTNDYPVIVQTWVDNGAGEPTSANAPFVVLPAVFHMQPKGIQGLRILYNQEPLPTDRESVFWLNLYEIPPDTKSTKDARRITLAMNTQMKIFYRPKGLSLSLEDAVGKLNFSLRHDDKQWFIKCENPTPLHVSFTSITLREGGAEQPVELQPDMMISPFSQKSYRLSQSVNVTSNASVRFRYLNDAGDQHEGNAKL